MSIIGDLERLVADQGCTFIDCADDPEFDLNDDGRVDVNDQLLVRDMPSDDTNAAALALMRAIRERVGVNSSDDSYDQALDVDRDGDIDIADIDAIGNAILTDDVPR